MIETRDLIRIIKRVRRKRLRILELCNVLLREDGTVDPEKVAFYAKELLEATKEAEDYSETTHKAVRCLRELARS